MNRELSPLWRLRMDHTKTELQKRRRPTSLRQEDPWRTKQSGTGRRMPLPGERIYLRENEKAPAGVYVQDGPRGGRFYVAKDPGSSPEIEPPKGTGGSMGSVVSTSDKNPDREVVTPGSEESTVEIEMSSENTVARVREALARENIPYSVSGKPGYTLTDLTDQVEVTAVHPDGGKATQLARRIDSVLGQDGLDSRRDGLVCSVALLKGDTSDEGSLSSELTPDPLLSRSADEAERISSKVIKALGGSGEFSEDEVRSSIVKSLRSVEASSARLIRKAQAGKA